ncbi:MAG: hypothetical protein R6V75_06220 [Bacteroidales bacterium]
MKTKRNIIPILLATLLAMTACEDRIIEVFTANSPIYMSYEELRLSVRQSDVRELESPGKIYFKDDYIFIVEVMQGIHVIDNSNPSEPVNLTFLEVPGNVDIAIKGSILYADSYVDLVALDVSDLQNVTEVGRVEGVLPYTLPPYDEDYPLARIEEKKGVVAGWEIKKVRQQVESYYYPVYWKGEGWMNDAAGGVSSGGVGSGGVGVGGSMARFGIRENTLYAVDNTTLHIFSISDAANPLFKKDFEAGWGIETLFILGDRMFLGTQTGMRIYDISVPSSPMYLADFWHVTGCDPVVVQDDLAYITIRGGTTCRNTAVNQLVVVSVAQITKPVELATYPMEEPYGLGIDGSTLFLCDGEAGLKVYDVSDPLRISQNLITRFPDIRGYDVIPMDGVLMLIGADGLYQYDYSNVNQIRLLSRIGVKKD